MAENDEPRRTRQTKAKRKNVQDPSQNVLFTEGMMRGEEPGHLLDPEDINSYDGLTYREHNERIIKGLLSNTGKDSEVTGLELYRRMFCIDQEEVLEFNPDEDHRVQRNMERPFETRNGETVRTYRTNPVAYYRNELDNPKSGRFRILFRDEFDMRITELQSKPFAIISGLTYCGKRNKLENAGTLYALLFDLDGCTADTVTTLFALFRMEELPSPNYIVSSGSGLHLIYLMKPMSFNQPGIQAWMKYIKRVMTHMLWNKYTSTLPLPQIQGCNQGFRIVGGQSKITGIRVRAFSYRVDRYTLPELESYIAPGDEEKVLSSGRFQKPPRPDLKTRTPLAEAKEKWPEWWARVQDAQERGVQRQPGSWVCHRGLYDWWLKKIDEPGAVRVGSRYWTTLCTAVMAVKAGVSFEEVEKDMRSRLSRFNDLGYPRYPFTEEDLRDGLKGYRHPHAFRFSIQTISALSGIKIEKREHPFLDAYYRQQKRMAEKRGEVYVPEKMTREKWLAEFARPRAMETIKKFDINWREGCGRKSCVPKLKEWIDAHPYARIGDANNDPELNLSASAIAKHWKECGGLSSAERVDRWLDDHPAATWQECAEALQITRVTVQAHIRNRKAEKGGHIDGGENKDKGTGETDAGEREGADS